MRQGKQAKTLSDPQTQAMLAMLTATRAPERNAVIFLLSARAGLRAKEIAALEWRMVLTAEGKVGNTIALEDKAAKAGSGGTIPLHKSLKRALTTLHALTGGKRTDPVVRSERGHEAMTAQVIVNLFQRWYEGMEFEGCSSHSGRRTFITKLAKNVSRVGGSLRDVQSMARHTSLASTQRYIEADSQAQRKLIDLI